ncbi:MAG: TIGR00730 family Rossman fold protein [Betaproteobacteria bacterium]|nr:TIGR00730 family Rossman fold protein [Betaproteobacteria bacterium]
MKTLDSICLYCASSPGGDPAFRAAAEHLGRTFAKHNIRLVFGGGSVGLMGVAAGACLEAGGEVTGVITRLLMEKEVGHPGVKDMHIVETMHERKALMTRLSQGFIALPGGYGTLDELFDTLTLLQLGVHHHPVGLLNVSGFFDSLVAFLDRARDDRVLRDVNRDSLFVESDLETLIGKMRRFEAPDANKWLDRAAVELRV